MKEIINTIYSMARDDDAYGEKFFFSIAIVLAIFLALKLLKILVNKITKKEKLRYKIKRYASFAIIIIGFIGIMYTWFNALNGLMAALSIIIALAVISLKDLILNFAGFAYLTIKKPFYMGDRIEIHGYIGDVIDIELFQFEIAEVGNWLESQSHSGRTIYFPNQDIFSEPISNFTDNFPYIWHNLTLPITHVSNVEKAMDIMETIGHEMLATLIEKDQMDDDKKKALQKLGDRIQLFDGSILPKVHIRVDGNGINCILRYLCPVREIATYETIIWRRILSAMSYHKDLEFSPEVLRVIHSKAEPYQ